MQKLFGRNIELVLESTRSTGSGQAKETKTFSSKDGFSIEFDVQFGTRASSTVKIYNVLPSTVEMCKPEKSNSKQIKSAKLELSAGYGDELSLLLSANILSYEQKISGVDRILEIKAGSNVDVLQNTYVVETYQNQTMPAILKNIFQSNSISFYEINLDSSEVVSSISFANTLQNVLVDICKKAKAVFYMRNGKIIIETKEAKGKRESDLVFLSNESGLIGSPEINGSKLKVKSLLNPNLNAGQVFAMDYFSAFENKTISGNYKIGNGKHSGGDKIQSFFTELECVKV